MVEISGWRNLFLEVCALSESAERQYGIAHLSYSNYILERLALCIDTCSNIHVVSTLASDLQECSRNLTELIETLQRLHNRWEEYKSFLEGPTQYNTLLTTQQLGRGRLQFQVSKSQVEYLASLSFKWTEIASILGLSRMTLYRYDM